MMFLRMPELWRDSRSRVKELTKVSVSHHYYEDNYRDGLVLLGVKEVTEAKVACG